MALLTDEVRAFIGVGSAPKTACDKVERSEVRRYAQAIMDDDPVYVSRESSGRYQDPVAPPLFPTMMFRRDFGTPDPVTENASNPDYDGTAGMSLGLPSLPLPKLALLNGGSEVEFIRYARHGETVVSQSRYSDIYEKESSKGPMLFVVMETEYRTDGGDLLMKNRQTIIRR
jgi:hypothetical protein